VDYDYDHCVTTDSEGRFVLRGYDDGAEDITVTAAGYIELEIPVARIPESGVLVMEKAYRFSGTVKDSDTGEPVRIDDLLLCKVERNPGGAVRLWG